MLTCLPSGSFCLSVWLSVRPSVCLSICLSVCLHVCLHVCFLSVRPAVCPSVHLSVCLSVCLCVCCPSPCLAICLPVCLASCQSVPAICLPLISKICWSSSAASLMPHVLAHPVLPALFSSLSAWSVASGKACCMSHCLAYTLSVDGQPVEVRHVNVDWWCPTPCRCSLSSALQPGCSLVIADRHLPQRD